jgi:uncharacterized membrane protein YfcA
MNFEQLWAFLNAPLPNAAAVTDLIAPLLAIGFGIGLLTGIFGVGGGFLMVPTLNKVIGLPYDMASAVSLCFTVGTSISALRIKLRRAEVDTRALLFMALPSILGTLGGDRLQNVLKTQLAVDEAAFNRAMNLIFILFLLLITVIILTDAFRKKAAGSSHRLTLPPCVRLSTPEIPPVSIIGLFLCGGLVGFFSGLLGIGGGIIFIPLLVIGVGMTMPAAAGTSVGVIFVTAIAGVIKKSLYSEPKINLPVVIILLCGSFIGLKSGIAFAGRRKEKTLKLLLGGIVAAAAATLALLETV